MSSSSIGDSGMPGIARIGDQLGERTRTVASAGPSMTKTCSSVGQRREPVARRSRARRASPISTFAPESSSPNSSSSAFHHAFSGTSAAPSDRARPERDDPLGHCSPSTSATRSPAPTPSAPSERREHAGEPVVLAEGEAADRPARPSRRRRAPRSAPSARAASACAACRPASDARATSSTTISNGPPGPVSCAMGSIGGSPTAIERGHAYSSCTTSNDEQVAPGADRTLRRCAGRGPARTPGCSASARSPRRSASACTRGTRPGRRSGAGARTPRSPPSWRPRRPGSRSARPARRPARAGR